MTQHINTMNKGILHKYRLLAIGLMLTCLSCSKAQLSHDSDIAIGNSVEMRLTLDAPASSSVSNNETDINRLRVVVFGSMTSPDAGRLVMNKFYATVPADNSFKEMITAGRRDIFIIVNEPLSGGGQELESYKSIASVSDVRALSLLYDGAGAAALYVPSEIPMFIEHINKQVLVDSPNEISGAVERVMAKVTMKLNVKHSNFATAGKHIVIDNITIKNLPQSSSWIAKDYAGALVASEKQNSQVVAAESGYDFSSNNTFYVPEYIFNNADEGAYIEISGHINGEASRIAKYIVKLGDAMDDGGRYGDKYNITRNRHYTFTGDVKSYGEMEDLAVKVTVLPWTTVDMSEEVGHYVSFSKVTNASDVVIAEGSNLNMMGETVKVSCNTNIGGWYAVVRNSKGDVVHTSAPTPTVMVAGEQILEVAVPKLTVPRLETYTVSVFHPAIANENIGPIKELQFAQYGGFIPNSVLTAAGWPDTNLPLDGGLQVATRGNVLTGGTPLTDDPTIVWSTESVATGLTAVGLGKGKENYALLATLDVAKYPIGQACKHLGPEWYVPSKDELKLLYDNKSLLTASYAFTANVYWSATEATSDNSWYVSFLNGDASSGSTKSGTNSVRCVRGGVYPAAISVTPTVQADIPAAGGKYTVQLTSNYGWSVSSTNSGVTFSPSEGAPGLNMPVEITIPVNAITSAVSYPVVFTTTDGSTTATATWTGNQLAALPTYIEINGLKWAIGNLVADGANGAKIGAPIDGGLYFQFGSLLGWSGGASGDGVGIAGSPALAVNIKPTGYTGTTVYTTCGYSSAGFPATDNAATGIGDPCRYYLGGTWRLPTAVECKTMCNNYGGGSAPGLANAAWTTSPSAGMNFNNNSTKYFIPASGCRNNSVGALYNVEQGGYFSSSSVYDATYGYSLYFIDGSVSPQYAIHRRASFPVRCVQ